MPKFIHLHNHSHYSLLDAACTIDALLDTAKMHDMPAFALTDHGVMFGAIEFYKKAKKRGIKPIIGNEMYMVTRGSRFDKQKLGDKHPEGKRHGYNHIVLLAKNRTGYRNLMKLTSLGFLEGFYYKPRIDFELLEKYHEGLIALTACAGGVVASYLATNDYDMAKQIARKLKDIFEDDLYLEIQNHGLERETVVRDGMARLSQELGIKLIATNDIHYIKREHAVAHNVYLLIADTREAPDVTNLRYEVEEFYFKSADEMVELFADYPQAVASTLEVAEKCELDLDLNVNHMPDFPIPEDRGVSTLEELLRLEAEEGLGRRYPEITDEIRRRMDYELDVIIRMGYPGYFLITADFINAARKKGILVGPGRGSAAGSLVAYCLGITDVDPLRYGLLFERFLNPDRVSMPDIDVDFQDDRREEVIDYVREKYGKDSVAQIITFGRLSSRAIIKDVGRVLGIPLHEVETITKNITTRMGKVEPLAFALGLEKDPEPDPEKRWYAVRDLDWVGKSRDDKIRQLVEYSRVLEDLNRNAGMHAAGVVIAPSAVSDYSPLYKTTNTEVMTQYNMKDLEDAGLLKMDFLGLITLTVLARTLELIQKHRGIEINLDAIPLDDSRTYEMIGEGHTVGVFQFESAPMQDYLRKLKPQSILDLAAMNALYRPGPMQFIDEFIDRKFGRKQVTYIHEKLRPILEETYGIIVYQEQVMRIVSEIAGFTLAEADIMRRAMGKKSATLMAEQRKAFISGATERGMPEKTAADIFSMIEKFANYGFNKSHSVAYSILAYRTAYFKANYTPEFMAALLTAEMAKTDKIVPLIDECRKFGIKVLPPDINESEVSFVVTEEGIRFGLAGIKNVGVGAVEEILRARQEGGPFRTIFDFCARVNSKAVNKKVAESLVLAGAMDSLEGNRAQLFASIESALTYGQRCQQYSERGQANLFETPDDTSAVSVMEPALPAHEDWSEEDKLAKEKSVLGFYVSGHPLEKWRTDAEALSSIRLGQPETYREGEDIPVCGVLSNVRNKTSRIGRTMALASLEDFTGKAECVFLPDVYKEQGHKIRNEAIVVLIGRVETSGDSLRLIPSEIMEIEEAIPKLARRLLFEVPMTSASAHLIHQVKAVLDEMAVKGNCPCYFVVANGASERWKLVSRKYSVKPTAELLRRLRSIMGENNVRIFT